MIVIAAIRAELSKIMTVRLWWVLLLVLVGYVGFTAVVLALAFGNSGDQPGLGLGTPSPIPDGALPTLIYSVASSIGYAFPVLFGTLVATGEFHHQTLTPTFLATPRRGIVLTAKFAVTAAFGAGYGVVALAASVGLGATILAMAGHPTALDDGDTWLLLARVVLAMAIWGVVGVGLGVLVPSQVAAIVIVLAFTQFIEPILRLVASLVDWAGGIGKFLPGAAGDALVGSSIFTMVGSTGSASTVLEWWQGGLLLLAYALVVGVIGYLTSWRRDVT